MIRVLKEHIANVKELRDKFYEDLISEKDGQKIQWGAAEIMFFVVALIFLACGIVFTIYRPEQIVFMVLFYWIFAGMFTLMVELCIMKHYFQKDMDPYVKRYKYNWLFRVAILTNLPIIIMACMISRALNEKDIDIDTYMIPFQILPVDLFLILAALGFIDCHAAKLDELIANNAKTFGGCDIYAILVLIIFALTLLIMYLVNFIIYGVLNKQKEKRILARGNEILEQDIDKEERNSDLVSESVDKTNKEKEIIDQKFQHGWDYIKTTIAKFQLIALIFIFVVIALFPGKAGILDQNGMIDEQLKASYLNAITLVTLIMLYLDKHNAWDAKLQVNKDSNADDAKKDDDKKKNFFVH